ncbi:hypothetical protein JD79_02652 [Geodermatophilus normandii]|uniref:Uncharacterized protein n=2 Tax=Geodermatophilus normandii TaxID=1137989 RepID=A0A317QIH8_9ACTN|nr:hypothetical protein JD79_02652 [Geodermatophilus normandii]
MVWAGKAWAALQALNDYAAQKSAGKHNLNFYRFCADPPPGSLTINPSWVAIGESDSTRNDPTTRSARMFPVPTAVNSSGTAFMEAHIKVQRRGGLAPRIHYVDDSQQSGMVYVGYFGRHLPLPD